MTAIHEHDDQPTRLRPDSRPVVLTATWLVGLLAGTSFALGVPGLVGVAAWAELPPLLRGGVPLLLDGGLLVFALVATVRRARHEPARFAWTALTFLTLASMAAQVAHVLAAGMGTWQTATGAALAAVFPATVFASTHSLIDLAVAPAPTRTRRARPATAPARPTPATTPAPALQAITATRTTPARRPTTDPTIAAEVRRLADAERLSQRAIADRTGLSKSAVQRLLTATP
ncbi:hypothetical protein [Cellulomonas hominis]